MLLGRISWRTHRPQILLTVPGLLLGSSESACHKARECDTSATRSRTPSSRNTHTHTHTHTHDTHARTHARTHSRTHVRARTQTHTPKCNDRQKHTWCALCAWRALIEAAAANILLSASKFKEGRAGNFFVCVHQTGGPAASARAPFFRARARLLLVSEYSQASDDWIRSATD